MLLLLRYCFRAGEIRLFAAWLDEQRQRGKTNGYHTRANDANGLRVDHRDAYQQTNDAGDKPHKPYNGAEGMECATRFLVARTNVNVAQPAWKSMRIMASRPQAQDWGLQLADARLSIFL